MDSRPHAPENIDTDKTEENKSGSRPVDANYTAANGLLSRRHFISSSIGLGSLALLQAQPGYGSQLTEPPPSWQKPGNAFSNYGQQTDREGSPIRWISNHPVAQGDGVSWTPHHQLEGTLTPNGLHFERHHNGVPSIDENTWEIAVHGLVREARAYSIQDLLRMPMTSKQCFIECGGNSNALWRNQPIQTTAGYMHGLMSSAEWTGVKLSTLLDYVGMDTNASWVIADALDSAGVSISIPIDKALDDAMIALYQNGERVREEQGFPARLVLPGWEGITHVKWLRSLTLTNKPLLSKYETVSYTDLLATGKAERFSFEMGVKSFITNPSPGFRLESRGVYEIKGLAWTGAGKIKTVEVSADGGSTWATAALENTQAHALTRFRIPWHWEGQPAQLVSRATDENGSVQPSRDALVSSKGSNVYYHYNGMTLWGVNEDGSIRHVY